MLLFDVKTVYAGGGLYLHRRCNGTIRNCTFVDHDSLGAVYEHALPENELRNCIFWGNAVPIVSDGSLFEVSDSLIPGGWPGGTNIQTADPTFVAPAEGDYRLLHGSPAVDAAIPLRARMSITECEADAVTRAFLRAARLLAVRGVRVGDHAG